MREQQEGQISRVFLLKQASKAQQIKKNLFKTKITQERDDLKIAPSYKSCFQNGEQLVTAGMQNFDTASIQAHI